MDADPIDADPVDADPIDADPIDADPVDADPVDADPIDADPIDADPIDAAPSDAAPADGGLGGGAAECLPFTSGTTEIELTVDGYGEGARIGPEASLRTLSANGLTLIYQTQGVQFLPFIEADENTFAAPHLIAFDSATGVVEPLAQAQGQVGVDATGRYVAWAHANTAQVVLRDRVARTTEVISVSTTGGSGNGASSSPSLSADANRVAFLSTSSNLITGGNGLLAVYLRDRQAGTTTRISAPIGGGAPSAPPGPPLISGDGNFVLFRSSANNLVPSDTNNAADLFLYDVAQATLARVNTSAAGDQANAGVAEGIDLSADGQRILFVSTATNLDPTDQDGVPNVFIKDRSTGAIIRLPASSQSCGGWAGMESISGNGRFVAHCDTDTIFRVTDLSTLTYEELVLRPYTEAVRLSSDGTILAYEVEVSVYAQAVPSALTVGSPVACPPPPPTGVEGWSWKAAPYHLFSRQAYSVTRAGDQVVVWGGNPADSTGLLYDIATNSIGVLTIPGAVRPGTRHTATWMGGTELLIFGGQASVAGTNPPHRIDSVLLSSVEVSATDRPSVRNGHSAVWTGTEVLIWGGQGAAIYNDGGRYQATLDQWAPISTAGAPTARRDHVAAWTGTEMLVWGGSAGASGGRYDPNLDAWSPMDTSGPAASAGIWTGSELFVWNGTAGGRYDPLTNTWSAVGAGGPGAGYFFLASRPGVVLVFGESAVAAYDLVAESWIPLNYPLYGPDFSSYNVAGGADLGAEVLLWNSRAARFGP
ncbi:MAG: PD40 domain-containing protein [Deltaproteobacteria bacterium]|nr:PD40 domain-containing protein [Deltaproteobacteria bacterium]